MTFELLKSDDPEVLSSIVSSALSKVLYTPYPGERAFSHAVKIVQIGEFTIWKSSSISGFELKAEDAQNSRFEIHFVEFGQYHSVTNNQVVTAGHDQAYIVHQFNKHSILCRPGTEQICISIPEARYAKLVASEFDDPDAPLATFRPVVELDCPKMRNLKRLAGMLMSLGCYETASWQTSVGAHLLTEAFLALFIEGWPRDGEYYLSAQAAKPFYVKRALDWMHEHASEKILLEDLSLASGVSIRTLQLGFRKFLGLSPMGYLLKIRLQKAHSDLLNEPSFTIDQVASRWGFPSSSKFASQIRDRYGHNPSDLRKLSQIRRHR